MTAAVEHVALAECEAIIERGLNTFVEVGSALLRIRDERLYRQGYRDFESYCQTRWGFGRERAHRLISAAEVVERMLPIGNTVPINEGQARELVGLAPETAVQVMDLAAESGEKVTARSIREARQQVEDPAPTRQLTDAEEARVATEVEALIHADEDDDDPELTEEECRALADPADLYDDEPAVDPDPEPEDRPRRRRPITDAFWSATYELERRLTTLKNLAKDDRAKRNADQIREQTLPYLIRARDELSLVIDQLSN